MKKQTKDTLIKNIDIRTSTVVALVVSVLTMLGYELSKIEVNYITMFVTATYAVLRCYFQSIKLRDANFKMILERFEHVERKIDLFSDLTRYMAEAPVLTEKLLEDVNIRIERINEELANNLQDAFVAISPALSRILTTRFEGFKADFLYRQLIAAKESVTINYQELDIQKGKIEDYKKRLNDELDLIFDNFSYRVETIGKTKANGARYDSFEDECFRFIKNVISRSISIYNVYRK